MGEPAKRVCYCHHMTQDQESHTKSGYDFSVLPIRGVDGFRLAYLQGGKVVASESCIRVTSFDVFPPEIADLLRQKSESGVPTYIGNISVGPEFTQKGLGTAIWRASIRHLTEQHPRVIVSNVDDAVPPGWTTRRIPEIRAYMETMGWKSEIIFQGETDNKPTWVIEYSPKAEP